MSFKTISMSDLHGMTGEIPSTSIVLDVRTPSEYAEGHIKGSLNIPHDQIAGHLESLRKYEQIFIHCRSGARATAAAQTLIRAGFSNVVCISGSGMADWIASGFPVERKS